MTQPPLPPALDDLRYPIGKFHRPQGDPAGDLAAARRVHIESLRQLPSRLSGAVRGLDDAQLDTPYRDGGWTVRQVVHHVADSHINAYVRIRFALTEDWPTIKPYQESEWARLPDASRMPPEVSLALLTSLHERWAMLLESLPDDAFARGYVHPENGRQALSTVIAMYDWHGRHHTAHVVGLRDRMGW